MESKGSGFDKIEQDYAGKGEAFRPFISSDGSSFTLVLPNLTFAEGVIDEDSEPEVHVQGVLDGKNDAAILSFCFRKARTAKEIADKLGIQASTYFRKLVLGNLAGQGYLLEDSSEGAAKYLSDKVDARPDATLPRSWTRSRRPCAGCRRRHPRR